MKQKRVNYICASCGSDDLFYDASAAWNSDTQEFELNNVYDSKPTCGECGYEGWSETVEVKDD